MKKELNKIAKKYGCTITEFNYVNNFDWRYYGIRMDDKEGLHLDEYAFEYCVSDPEGKEQQLVLFEDFIKGQIEL